MLNQNFVERAMKAWFRAGGEELPSNLSDEVSHDGLRYVVLENVNGVLAVYRITNSEKLRRLRRWPKGLEAA